VEGRPAGLEEGKLGTHMGLCSLSFLTDCSLHQVALEVVLHSLSFKRVWPLEADLAFFPVGSP
jgi:hypothetical protein